MTLRIISAEDILFEGEVKLVKLPGAMGGFTVLPHHASLISTLVAGSIEYELPDNSRTGVEVSGGLVDVHNDVVSVCVY